MKRDRTRIAVLIAVAVVAITLAVLQALADVPHATTPGTARPVADEIRD
jgi:hypothetical protein